MKPRSSRERQEARMRLRNSIPELKRVQRRLKRNGHSPTDPHWKAVMGNFWGKLRVDKRTARGDF